MFTPYIRFNGNCEEAFLWYAQVFNGKVQHLSRYSDSSPNSDIFSTDKLNGKVMHARLTITDFNVQDKYGVTWIVSAMKTV